MIDIAYAMGTGGSGATGPGSRRIFIADPDYPDVRYILFSAYSASAEKNQRTS